MRGNHVLYKILVFVINPKLTTYHSSDFTKELHGYYLLPLVM